METYTFSRLHKPARSCWISQRSSANSHQPERPGSGRGLEMGGGSGVVARRMICTGENRR
jgi:hypothetical protein